MKLVNILFALALLPFLAKGQCPNGLAVAVPNQTLTCATPSTQIVVSVTGGVQPYTYLWANGFTTPVVPVFVPGSYCVTVTDAVGCTATGCGFITQDADVPVVSISGPTVIDCNGGPITLLASTNIPNAVFQWTGPNGWTVNTAFPIVSVAGTYTVVVTNPANGCTSTATIVVTGQSLNLSTSPISCHGAADGTASVNVPGATSYEWAGNGNTFTTPTISNLAAGDYGVTVTLPDGSTCSETFSIYEPPAIELQGNTTSIATCGETSIGIDAVGGVPPYAYQWSDGQTGQFPTFTFSAQYSVTIIDANGCTLAPSPFNITVIADGCNRILGKITRDTSLNCLADPGEEGIAGCIVKAVKTTGETFYGLTDAAGNYSIGALAGSYFVEAVPPSALFEKCQPDQINLTFPDTDDTLTADFVLKAPIDCPDLSVNLSAGLLRRCLSNNFYNAWYCNLGTGPAIGAAVEIALDPLMSIVSSSATFTDLGGDHYLFEVGDLDPGECGSFWLQIQLSCDAQLGQTLCTEAAISADNGCPPAPTAPLLAVTHECAADSLRFFIENNSGVPIPTGYVVIEDAVMLTAPGGNSAILPVGVQMPIALPKNGSTWRVEANIISTPIAAWASVEGCGVNTIGTFSTGYVNLFPQDPSDPASDVFCQTVVGSFDPNDKAARPEGFGAAHFIKNGTEIEYRIRFQNTGTDTAFTVAIRDTLDAALDPETFRPGASSHAYEVSLAGEGVVIFSYKNILLPDSFVNEPASHGYVDFSIKTRDVPDGTVIKNDAAIFFDLNEPVITNEVFHTIGTGFVPSAIQFFPSEKAKLTAAPNPFYEKTVVEMEGPAAAQPMLLRVFDMFSKEIRREKVGAGRFPFERRGLPTGFYFLLLEDEKGQVLGSGRLVIR